MGAGALHAQSFMCTPAPVLGAQEAQDEEAVAEEAAAAGPVAGVCVCV